MSGPQPYDTVSNTISIQATVTDLSGVTNEQFEITVDGFKARYSIGASNTISLETKYNPNGAVTVYANTANSARIFDPTNPPDNSKLFFSGSTALPLDFENDTYLVSASDNASTNIGVNYFLFSIDKAQDIDATITDPLTGQVVAHYSGHIPYAATVSLAWDFTQANHSTPYSNDTYVVSFTAFDPTTLNITNKIDRHGVRVAGKNILTYEEENPALSGGSYLNSQANTIMNSLESGLYENLYQNHVFSFTMYYTYQIGSNRENLFSYLFPLVLTHGNESSWASQAMGALENLDFSDFTYYMGHGNGTEIGGGPAGDHYVDSYGTSGFPYESLLWPWFILL